MADSDSFSEPMQVDAPLEFSDDDETDNRSDIEQPIVDDTNKTLESASILRKQWNLGGTQDNEQDKNNLRLCEV